MEREICITRSGDKSLEVDQRVVNGSWVRIVIVQPQASLPTKLRLTSRARAVQGVPRCNDSQTKYEPCASRSIGCVFLDAQRRIASSWRAGGRKASHPICTLVHDGRLDAFRVGHMTTWNSTRTILDESWGWRSIVARPIFEQF